MAGGGVGRFALQRQQQNNDDSGKTDAAKRKLAEKRQLAASSEASLKHATDRYNDAKQQVDNAKKQADVARAQVKEAEEHLQIVELKYKKNDDEERTVSVLKEQVECAICIEIMKDAKSLNCGHSFWKELLPSLSNFINRETQIFQWCIQQYLEKSNRCPSCRAVVGSNPLIPNYAVMSIIESLKGQVPTSLKSKRTKDASLDNTDLVDDNDDSSTTAVMEAPTNNASGNGGGSEQQQDVNTAAASGSHGFSADQTNQTTSPSTAFNTFNNINDRQATSGPHGFSAINDLFGGLNNGMMDNTTTFDPMAAAEAAFGDLGGSSGNSTDLSQGFSQSFDPMAAAAAEALFQNFGGYNTTTDNPSDEQSPTLAVLANAATETSTSMSRNTNTYTDNNGDNEVVVVPTDSTEASAPTRQSRGQQTSGSKSSWRSRPSESPLLPGLMDQREATQRAQQNVMNAGTKRSFMSSMNSMNRTKSPGAHFRPFYSGNNNSAVRSFQPPSSSAKSMTIRPPYLMNRNTMTTSNSHGVEALSKSRPDNKRRKTQPPEKSPSEEAKVFVDNLDLATNEARLREVFEIFGCVTSVNLYHVPNMRGFGFIRFGSRTSAENAIKIMHQSQLDGQTLHVNENGRLKG